MFQGAISYIVNVYRISIIHNLLSFSVEIKIRTHTLVEVFKRRGGFVSEKNLHYDFEITTDLKAPQEGQMFGWG